MNPLVRMEVVVLPPASVETLARRHWTAPALVLRAMRGMQSGDKRPLEVETPVTRQEIRQRIEAASGGERAAMEDVARAMDDAGIDVILVPALKHVAAVLPVLQRAAVSVQAVGSVSEVSVAENALVGVWPSPDDVARMTPLVRPHIEGAHSALVQATEALGDGVLPVRLRAAGVVGRALRLLAVSLAYAIGVSVVAGVGADSRRLRIAAVFAVLRGVSTTVWGDAPEGAQDSPLVTVFLDVMLEAPSCAAGQRASREIGHMIDGLTIRDGSAWRWPGTMGIGQVLGVCMDLARAYEVQDTERALRAKHTVQAAARTTE